MTEANVRNKLVCLLVLLFPASACFARKGATGKVPGTFLAPFYNKNIVPGYFGTLKAFLPSELAALINANGLNVKTCHALGSLTNLAGKDTVDFVKQNQRAMETFLDLCEDFDQNIMPCGPGTKQRAGLIAIAERRQHL